MMRFHVYVAVVVLGLVALFATLHWYGREHYEAGWNAHAQAQAAAIEEAQKHAVEQARAEWEANREIAEGEIIVGTRIVERVRDVERKIPVVVDRVVPDCRDLGGDVLGLLNDQIRAGAGGGDPTAEPAAESHDAVPADAGI